GLDRDLVEDFAAEELEGAVGIAEADTEEEADQLLVGVRLAAEPAGQRVERDAEDDADQPAPEEPCSAQQWRHRPAGAVAGDDVHFVDAVEQALQLAGLVGHVTGRVADEWMLGCGEPGAQRGPEAARRLLRQDLQTRLSGGEVGARLRGAVAAAVIYEDD